ncbi:FUSC family protein [Acetobacter cibinongensis]|uniref:FUSC family protein n=1 Tax=Acetobacter cibinongensis TaxID=146475 RepID=UPI000A3A466C|nr:FUSC family protein [Acetobacter cibinongensis]
MSRTRQQAGQSGAVAYAGLLSWFVPSWFHSRPKPWRDKLKWLIQPSLADLAFAVRSAFAAGLSLLIAMWMELDSPQWAPLSVWVVAQSSRGESLSKARWRIIGTVVGCCVGVALIAAFPQETALFFGALALWVGLCCGLATFLESYRAYGLVLTGFTSAIVATGAISEPDHVFDIAIARGSYIILGVVCEAALAILCTPSLREQAKRNLRQRLNGALQAVTSMVTDMLDGKATPQTQAQVLTTLVTANSRIEFDALELGPHTHAGDHAKAALSHLMVMLARARGIALLARQQPAGMAQDNVFPTALKSDYTSACHHIQASETPQKNDRFRFKMTSRRHVREALENGIRSAAGITAAWLVWEVTAWPSGAAFISFVALVYGLLATRENPILASSAFFKGAVWCALAAGLYAFMVMPLVTTPEMLLLALMVPMTIGGLAARHANTAGYAFSFNMFLPVLLGPSNTGRYDEQSFLNGALAFLFAVLFVGWTYRAILPFHIDSHMRRTRAWRIQSLKHLAEKNDHTTMQQWLSGSADSLVRILRNAQGVPEPLRLAYMQEQLQTMSLGMGVVLVRDAAQDPVIPVTARRGLRVFLRKWSQQGMSTLRWSPMVDHWLGSQIKNAPSGQSKEKLVQVRACLHAMAAEYNKA